MRLDGGGAETSAASGHQVVPALDRCSPDQICVSAGFGPHSDDPMVNLLRHEDDFAASRTCTCDIAATHCGGRVVSHLEGGYDLGALAAPVTAHVKILKERSA
ncbi:MAG: hypothetical protein Q7J57_14955 [Gemmobacter sp.]|nr:hypothetical protein [Gemmobacter sp.]